jgi:predicted enzyme related to lactoylglutathione lyase
MPAVNVIVHPVKDLAKAKSLYAALLGIEPYVDQPYYVGFRPGEVELGLDPKGHDKGMTGPVAYWAVDDLDGHLQRLVDAGATVRQPVTDVGGGRRIATVTDADGNVIGLQSDN